MNSDEYLRAKSVSSKSFAVGMGIWLLLLAGLFLMSAVEKFAEEGDGIVESSIGYDTYDMALEGEN